MSNAYSNTLKESLTEVSCLFDFIFFLSDESMSRSKTVAWWSEISLGKMKLAFWSCSQNYLCFIQSLLSYKAHKIRFR